MTQPHELSTIEAIMHDVRSCINEHTLDEIYAMQRDDLMSLHHDLGRFIRNRYQLWHTNPLTFGWREYPKGRLIVDGVDHSADHPDAVSSRVIYALWMYLQKERA